MFFQYCFDQQSRAAYKSTSKTIKPGTYKTYAVKIEALRNYVLSRGYSAPARIFDAVLIRDHLEEVKTRGKLSQGYISVLENALKFICKMNAQKGLPPHVALTIKAVRMSNPRENVPGILKIHYSPADINTILYKLYQSTRHTPYNMKIHRAILIVILSYYGMFRLYSLHILSFPHFLHLGSQT